MVDGRIQLPAGIDLPENSRVLVVVTDDATPLGRVATPLLAHSEQTKDFVLEVEIAADANV